MYNCQSFIDLHLDHTFSYVSTLKFDEGKNKTKRETNQLNEMKKKCFFCWREKENLSFNWFLPNSTAALHPLRKLHIFFLFSFLF